MSSIPGGDYSVARPSVDTMRNAGWKFVCRYLRDLDKTNGDKSLSAVEASRLINGGLTIVSNDETTGEQGLRGFIGALADAKAADAAHVTVGGPPDAPIYFSPWDHDPAALTVSDWTAIEKYLNGLIAILTVKRIGLYGGRQLVSWAFDKHLITYGWEAAGWKNGLGDPRMHIIQHVGSPIPGTDSNTAVKENFGGWSGVMSTMDLSDASERDLIRLIDHNDKTLPGNSFNHQELAKRLKSLDTRLAVLEAAVQSGVPVNLTEAQFDMLAAKIGTVIATNGLKLSGTMAGTINLGADA